MTSRLRMAYMAERQRFRSHVEAELEEARKMLLHARPGSASMDYAEHRIRRLEHELRNYK